MLELLKVRCGQEASASSKTMYYNRPLEITKVIKYVENVECETLGRHKTLFLGGGHNGSKSSRRKTPRVYKFWYRSRKYFFDLFHEYRENVLPSTPGAFANGSSVV